MFLGSNSASSAAEKCELFAAQFNTAFNNSVATRSQVENAVHDTPSDVLNFTTFRIDAEDVAKAIRKLKSSFSAGPDGIPSVLLKRCFPALHEPLAAIFNLSFRLKQFPSRWKYSFLFPVHKKGDKRDVRNYRGITSLSACSKVYEIIVNEALYASCSQYISIDQHGFVPKRSVTSNLAQFTSTCLQAMDNGKQIDAVYLDLKAAFDRVDHRILLKKLERLGMAQDCVEWFRSYLTNRSLCVKIGSCHSAHFRNVSGVPQGSNLGPLLFTIFINDVSLILSPGVKLFYADDAKIYVVVTSIDDCFELQGLLTRFEQWCANNCLTLSIEKCQVITFSRKRKPITFQYSLSGEFLERVHCVRDLGVILDEKLTFRLHYDEMITRANRQLGFIMKVTSDFQDPLCLKALYCALVRSILEFADVVWCPYQITWITRIESVQRKFVRFALRNLPWRNEQRLTSYQDRCQLLGMETLETRRRTAQAMYVVKLLNGNIDSSQLLATINVNAPERSLRRHNFLRLEGRNSRYGQHDPIRFMSNTFNSVAHLFDFNVPITSLQQRFMSFFRTFQTDN